MRGASLTFKSLYIHAFLALVLFACQGVIAKADGFPRVIAHALGETQVPQAPVRVVSIGWNGEDVLLALGIVPVGMTRYDFFESGILPWVEERLGNSTPVLFSGEIEYEAIAALRPDLIVGIYSGIDKVGFRRLSAIAPTVVYRSGPWKADWREQAELIGEAIGKPEEARRLVEATTAELSAFAKAYPILRGKTLTFGTYFSGSSSIVVYLPADPRVMALTELGLRPSQGVSVLSAANPDLTSVSVSLENISDIDADILVMWYDDNSRSVLEKQPLFQSLNAVRGSSYVPLDDPVDVWSTSALSVLSIPYGFSRFVPRLAEAAAKAEAR